MGKGGDGTSTASDGPAAGSVGALADARFLPFQQDNFNVAEFTSRVLAGSQTTAQAQSEQLREGVRLLDGELSAEVLAKNKQLLSNVRRMLDTESSLQQLVLSVESLQSAVRRIRAEIVGPYEQIKGRGVQLRNLHETVELLRHIIHRLKLTQKLRVQMAAPAAALDLAKAAKLLSDIRAVDSEVDLTAVEVVTVDAEFIAAAGRSVREQAEAAFLEGMESLSQAKVGSALQVFFNLDELKQAVSSLYARYLTDLDKAVKAALDSKQLSAGAGGSTTTGAVAGPGGARGLSQPSPGASSSWQDKLWSGLKEVLSQVQVAMTAVWHLQRVVSKKKDPLSHVCFLDVLLQPEEPLLTTKFWTDVVKVLHDSLLSASKPSKGGFVRDALTGGYPRLAALLEAMFERLSNETTMKGVLPAVVPDQLTQLLAATAPFQNAYMAACLARMSEAVVAAFPGGMRSVPSPADVQKCIALMHEELKVAGSSPQLAGMIATTTGKALQLLAEKAEYMAATGPDVRHITHTASASQIRNIALCSQLQEVHRSLNALLVRLPDTATPALSSALETLHNTGVEVAAPLFKSVMDMLEEKLLQLHSLRFTPDTPAVSSADDGTPVASTAFVPPPLVHTSSYVADVAGILATFRSEYLSKFVPPPSPNVPSCVGSLVERMACRLLLFFVRHAALVRPMPQAGKLQVAKDLVELQLAVGQHLFPLEQLGAPYRAVKAFRALLFQDTASMPSSPLLKDLPVAVTLHHLFSRLPPSVKAPHERSGLTPQQYSLWLDTRSVDEALRSIRGALDAASAAAQGDARSEEVLAVMLQLCMV